LDWILKEFILYWTAKNPKGIKEKWQMEKVFDINKRFLSFIKNDKKWNKTLIDKSNLWVL
jgi:hypothetical protein